MKKNNYLILSKVLMIIVGIFFLINVASAHLPRLVYNQTNSTTNPYIISNPEISQAFYGQFKNGNPEYYQVNLAKEQDLYLSLLVPDNKSSATGMSLTVIKLASPDSKFVMTLNGVNYNWQKYYEDYAGDNYWQGPSDTKKLTAGDYLISITSKDNLGKYVLVTGKIESFPPAEMFKTLLALPYLKIVFFETSFWTIFAGIIGKYLLWSFIALLAILFGLFSWIIIRRRNK